MEAAARGAGTIYYPRVLDGQGRILGARKDCIRKQSSTANRLTWQLSEGCKQSYTIPVAYINKENHLDCEIWEMGALTHLVTLPRIKV